VSSCKNLFLNTHLKMKMLNENDTIMEKKDFSFCADDAMKQKGKAFSVSLGDKRFASDVFIGEKFYAGEVSSFR
jgi:hypothetical protein